MGDNELGDRLDTLRQRWQYGGKIALESRIEAAKLLKAKYDADPAFRGERYEKFAFVHGIASNKTDANAMYLLGEFGDAYFARCEAESRLKLNFDWPSWRTACAEIRREQKKRGSAESEEEADESSDADDDAAPPDPISEFQRERDNLRKQVEAATQQYRNERAKREEVEEQIAALREQLAARDAEIATLKERQNDSPLSGRQAILQDIAKMLRGHIHNTRITGTTEQLLVNGYDDDKQLFVLAAWPAQPDITTEFALEIANNREAKELRDMLRANGVTLGNGHVVINETNRLREKATIREPAWQATLGPEAKVGLIAACRAAKAINQHKKVEVHAADGKLSFGSSLFAFDRDDLQWVLRKNWREFKVSAEGLIRVTVPGLLGDYVVYLRGYETGLAAEIERQRLMADIAELTDRANLRQIDDAFDNYWSDDLPPESPVPSGSESAPTIQEARFEDFSPEIVERNRAAVLDAILDTVLPPGDRRQGAFFGAVEQVKAMGGIINEEVLGCIRRAMSDEPHSVASIFAWATTRQILDRASIAMADRYQTEPPAPATDPAPAENVDQINLSNELSDAEMRQLTLQWGLKPFRGRAGPLDIVAYQRRCGFLKIVGPKLTQDQLVIVRKKSKAFWQEQGAGAAERWLGDILSPSTHDDVPMEPKDKPEAKSEDGDGEPPSVPPTSSCVC